MEWWQLYLILGVVVAGLVAAFIFLRRRMKRKVSEQQTMVNEHKVTTSILVLNKRMDKITNANMPKAVLNQVPAIYKVKKMPLVKAKVGQQVMDFLCDEAVFKKLPDKKTVNVELAGIFIAGIKQGKK